VIRKDLVEITLSDGTTAHGTALSHADGVLTLEDAEADEHRFAASDIEDVEIIDA
jgi:hypothetical protein